MRPIPPAHEHVQVNGCKTPGCENFGVPPREGRFLKGPGAALRGDGYAVVGTGSTGLSCKKCTKFSTLKSNKGVHEELQRQGSYLWVQSPLICDCGNTTRFRKYGKTRSGSDRWQCRDCKKTMSLGKPTRSQKKPHKNSLVFDLLVNKSPINRMMEIAELGVAALYGKIDFIYEQCRLFAAEREMKLRNMSFERLYLCTDRQDYMVNWGDRRARKTVQLTAIATADLKSGYLFAMSPNFDKSMLPGDLEDAAKKAGDADKPIPMRDFARVWTQDDYAGSVLRTATGSNKARDDLDAPEGLTDEQQLPTTGVQVHADYLMHGHYWLLRYLLPNVGKYRFFIDGDSGLLGACMGAFSGEIASRKADIVVAYISKTLNTIQRQNKNAEARAWFRDERKKYPDLSDKEAKTAIMAAQIAAIRAASPTPNTALQQTTITHPFPDAAEPEKRVRYVTDYGDYDDAHTANLLMKATLWPVDTVFNRIRRRIAFCERPIRSVRRANGLWDIYAPYDPAMIEKVLTIYRVWHNFVWVSPKTKKTAAEGLGLAAGKIRTQDILYFDIRDSLK
jgi:transposase-like protein